MNIDIQIIARIVETLGTLSIAWATLSVHHKVLHEHSIDAQVFSTMKREQRFAVVGIILILSGFILDLVSIVG
jgi:hypothetical protein